MKISERLLNFLTSGIAIVWLVFGLYCKVLSQVPRHREIVGEILGENYAPSLTVLIGLAEILMAVWVASRWKFWWCAAAQIVVVLAMNVIEQLTAPGLLQFGKLNFIIALAFVSLVIFHAYLLGKRNAKSAT